ncbi:MAG TPA: hypothetical protein VN282_09255 [Pyrinomonadaceae bacterium]|nr:hypothetical protein [Pyrinomonadaceae bacterium]
MPSSTTARFRKLRTCPQAETLLTSSAGATRGGRVAEHVSSCDFCGAEMQLLSRHAPPADTLPFAAPLTMPAALRRLAEDILAEPSDNRARFAESLMEIERLTLTDA